jgi:hypothetical protein
MDEGFAKQWQYSGGGAAILSLGQDGWLAVGLGPGTPETQPKPETIGFLPLPLTVPELKQLGTTVEVPLYGAGEETGLVTRYPWDWLNLPDPAAERAQHKRAGFANMAYFSPDCVVFPFAWTGNAPGGNYPTTMRMTSLCPGTNEQPPLVERPPAADGGTIRMPWTKR